MRPATVLHLHAARFGSVTACLGTQLAEVIRQASDLMPDLRWYVADVRTTGLQQPDWEQPVPTRVHDTAAMLERVAQIDQFESGVFAGVPASIGLPAFRDGGLWTEDEELADLGDAIVEVRAFDTTYISVASSDVQLVQGIDRRASQTRTACPI